VIAAKDIMNCEVVAISPETTVAEAIDTLLLYRISGLPIVDPRGRILGVITEYAMIAIAYDPLVLRDPVRLHMTKDVITVDAGEPLTKIADLFLVHRIRRILVVQDGQLAGLISRRDLLKAARHSRKALTNISPFASQSAVKSSEALCQTAN
jgi:CBS domain-containing protein